MNTGARFYKCDFQVHTPRDINFKGKDCVTIEDRMVYSKNFIKACREKEIDAVAITDHHDLAFYKFIKKAAEFEGLDNEDESNKLPLEKRIIVFPGIELTLEVPCQAIVLFDAFMEIDEILANKILTILGVGKINAHCESKTTLTERIKIDHIYEIYEKLDSLNELKGKYFVLPNIKKGGDFTILRSGLHNKYAEGKFIAGYLDGNIFENCSKEKGWSNIINGKTEAYGNRSIAVIQTSDNRHESFELLGTAHTWIKFHEPTAEGLRQACLAKDSRISQNNPKLPKVFISKVEIISSSFLQSFELDLNSQLNVLIGGRGTGKSSVLQYIMYALGFKDELTKNFIEETLKEGEVILDFEKNNVQYKIRKNLKEHLLKIGNNDWDLTNSKNLLDIIQIDAYTQKEISEHRTNRGDLVNHLIRFAIEDRISEYAKKLESNESSIREYFIDFLRMIKLIKQNLENEINKKSIIEQINELTTTISGQDNEQNIIKQKGINDEEKQYLKNYQEEYHKIITDLNNYIVSISLKTSLLNFDVANKNDIVLIESTIRESIENIKKSFLDFIEENYPPKNLEGINVQIENNHSIQTKQYEEAVEKLKNHEYAVKEIEKNRDILRKLEIEISQNTKEIELLNGTKFKLLRFLIFRMKLANEVFEIKKEEAKRLSTHSEGGMTIMLNFLDDFDSLLTNFLEGLSKVRGTSTEIESYFKEVLLNDPKKSSQKVLKFWINLFCKKIGISEDLEVQLKKSGIPNNQIQNSNIERVINLDENRFIDFALHVPNYKPQMEYYVSQTNKISFHSASYGQQAGAILNILLNQTHGPLIIDQPEDDLDNKVIHQITERICRTKENRQLIFSSHNANIAVNGDAELIIHFDHNSESKGEVKIKGAIDSVQIKNSILDIMEGGEKAFDLRKKKYNLS